MMTPAFALAAEYTVDGIGDQPDAAVGSGGCKTTVGTCTLRAAPSKRGVQPGALANELLAAELAPASSDLESILADLADVRSRVRGPVDAVALVREGREELEQRGLWRSSSTPPEVPLDQTSALIDYEGRDSDGAPG